MRPCRPTGRDPEQELHLGDQGSASAYRELRVSDCESHPQTAGQGAAEGMQPEVDRAAGKPTENPQHSNEVGRNTC